MFSKKNVSFVKNDRDWDKKGKSDFNARYHGKYGYSVSDAIWDD